MDDTQNIDFNVSNYTKENLYKFLGFEKGEIPSDQQIANSVQEKTAATQKPEFKNFFQKISDRLLKGEGEKGESSDMWQTEYSTPKQDKKDNKLDHRTNRMQQVHVNDDEDENFVMFRNKLNVGSTHRASVLQGTINPNMQNTINRRVNIDSQYRKQLFTTNGILIDGMAKLTLSTDFSLEFTEHLTNVLSLKLHSITIPPSWYAFSEKLGNTCMEIVDKIQPNIIKPITDVFEVRQNSNNDVPIKMLGTYIPILITKIPESIMNYILTLPLVPNPIFKVRENANNYYMICCNKGGGTYQALIISSLGRATFASSDMMAAGDDFDDEPWTLHQLPSAQVDMVDLAVLGKIVHKVKANLPFCKCIKNGNPGTISTFEDWLNLTYGSFIQFYIDPDTNKLTIENVSKTDLRIYFYRPEGFGAHLTDVDISLNNTPCGKLCKKPSFVNHNLGWEMGFRIHPDTKTGEVYLDINASGQITAPHSVNISGPKYFTLAIDDYNQNHLNKGLINILEVDETVSLPSYYNPNEQDYLKTNLNNERELEHTEAGLLHVHALRSLECTELYNEKNAKHPYVRKNINKPRKLTAAQIYSVNEIIANRNPVRSRVPAPSVSNTFAHIPLQRIATLREHHEQLVHHGTAEDSRTYFGPVHIRKMRVSLFDDKGAPVDLNGQDWSCTIEAEMLYQY
jgi:hypothetical protein